MTCKRSCSPTLALKIEKHRVAINSYYLIVVREVMRINEHTMCTSSSRSCDAVAIVGQTVKRMSVETRVRLAKLVAVKDRLLSQPLRSCIRSELRGCVNYIQHTLSRTQW